MLTGRLMLSIYEGILVSALILEIYVLVSSLKIAKQLIGIKDQIHDFDNINLPLAPFEYNFSSMFNKVFFGASSKCANGNVKNIHATFRRLEVLFIFLLLHHSSFEVSVVLVAGE